MSNVALIWGASGGIGAALVRALHAAQWRVFGVARREEAIPTEAELALHFDAEQSSHYERVIQRVAQETNAVQLMVYAVGSINYGKLAEIGAQGWQATHTSNVLGAYQAALATLELMPEGSQQVFIGAYIEHLHIPKMGAYAASKAALAELVISLQKEYRRHRFTLVRPGAVNTGFWSHVSLRLPSDAKAPDVVAEAILHHHFNMVDGDLNL